MWLSILTSKDDLNSEKFAFLNDFLIKINAFECQTDLIIRMLVQFILDVVEKVMALCFEHIFFKINWSNDTYLTLMNN